MTSWRHWEFDSSSYATNDRDIRAYAGPLEEYLIKSSSRMMKELECNMVCLNIKLAQYILKSGSR